MSTDTSFAARAQEENWLPVLELAIEEVFEIMLGSRVKPEARTVPGSEPSRGYTAMVGLAGALCGILTVCCDKRAAGQMAQAMLGAAAESESQVGDALGEICNMIAGNFKNKLAGTDERCMLSVPSVITGEEYSLHSMAEGHVMETFVVFEGSAITVRLQLQN